MVLTMADQKSRLLGYARVSTDDQKLDMQIDALVAHGVAQADIYTDKMGGGSTKRPGFTHAMKALRRGDVLVIWKLDRLGRNLGDLIRTGQEIADTGAHLRCLTGGIDTTTSGGMLTFHIFGAMAEFEKSLIGERTRAGLVAAKARGRVGGRKVQFTDEMKAVARGWLADDVPVGEVARRLGFTRTTIYKLVNEPREKGET